MNRSCLSLVLLLLVASLPDSSRAADVPRVECRTEKGQVAFVVDGRAVATYYYEHEKILRPFFAHLVAPSGARLTRNFPPIEGRDAVDHDTMHPGLWLAFGDLAGGDFWRNKDRVEHERFAEEPRGGDGQGSFVAVNRYLLGPARKPVVRETCRWEFAVRPSGYLLSCDATWSATEGEFAFGDQEEMGLGVRVAGELTAKSGGGLFDAAGRRAEKEIWGKSSAWCAAAREVDGQRFGLAVFPHKDNFRPSWFHARDYGLILANPFGRKALSGGPVSRVVVRPGEPLRLRFGVLHFSMKADERLDLSAALDDYHAAARDAGSR